MKDPQELVIFGNELAELSRSIVLSHPTLDVIHENKEDGSPVTAVDREVEQKLREYIDMKYPDHGILGEEFPNRDIDAEYVWVIDPIDGTKQYVTGIPVYGTLIAVAKAGRFVLGVMDFPATQDRWIGGCDHPTEWNGKRVRVKSCSELSRATVAPSDPFRGSAEQKLGSSKLAQTGCFSVWGAGSYGFALVASGKLDIAVDSGLEAFDFAAPAAVVEGAGGLAIDWSGAPLTLASQGGCVLFVGDNALLGPVVDILQKT